MSYKMRDNAVKAANNISADMQTTLKRFYIGMLDGERIYLSVPKFDCDWYWGFGYLGNRNCHFHLKNCASFLYDNHELQRKNMYDQLKGVFGDSLRIPDNKLWEFCEIAQTIYTMKESAEVFGRGGSHYTTNPDRETIKNTDIVETININVIPKQIRSLWKLLEEC